MGNGGSLSRSFPFHVLIFSHWNASRRRLRFIFHWKFAPFSFFFFKKPSFTLYRKNLLIFVSSIVQIICGITKLLSLASCGQRLTNAVKKAKSQLLLKKHGLLQTCDKHEKGPLELQEIDLLYKKLEDNSSLQPCNCFALHYGSLVTGFTVLLTFAIVLFQFRATDKTDVLCGCFNSTTIP